VHSAVIPDNLANGRPHLARLAPSWRDVMPKQKRIAIVGKASDTMLLAPFADPSWQVWVLNDTPQRNEVPRWDVLFEIHRHDQKQIAEMPEHYQWLQKGGSGKPVFMREHYPEYPDSIAFPLDEMLSQFRDYYTCTCSYEMALAIAMRPDEIGIWGVNMAIDSEYGSQRPSCEYWIGLAEGRGIKVTLPVQTDLVKALYRYGLDDIDMNDKWTARMDTFRQRQAVANENGKKCEIESAFLEGALQDMAYWKQHIPNPNRRK